MKQLLYFIAIIGLLTCNLPPSPKSNEVILGKWKEKKCVNAKFTLLKRNDTLFMKVKYKNGQIAYEPVIYDSDSNIKHPIEEDYRGEYYRVNADNDLEFLNKEGKIFAIGK